MFFSMFFCTYFRSCSANFVLNLISFLLKNFLWYYYQRNVNYDEIYNYTNGKYIEIAWAIVFYVNFPSLFNIFIIKYLLHVIIF